MSRGLLRMRSRTPQQPRPARDMTARAGSRVMEGEMCRLPARHGPCRYQGQRTLYYGLSVLFACPL